MENRGSLEIVTAALDAHGSRKSEEMAIFRDGKARLLIKRSKQQIVLMDALKICKTLYVCYSAVDEYIQRRWREAAIQPKRCFTSVRGF